MTPAPGPIRLLAVDIDGTLLDAAGKLPPANRQAIQAAAARGVEVVLATGRAFHHARPVAERLHAPVTLIVNNGALVKKPDGETLACRPVPRGRARTLVAGTRSAREGAALIFDRPDDRQYVYERIDWSHPQRRRYYEAHRACMTRVEPIETAIDDDPVTVTFNGRVADMRLLAGRVRGLPAAQGLSVTLTEYEARDFSLLDITAAGCSKGAALADLAAGRGVEPAGIMAVGDNLNDIDMLERAGHPVVMGNAVAALKRRGWPLTDGHDEAGLARAIRERVL